MTHPRRCFGRDESGSNLSLESEGEEGSELRGNCNVATIDEKFPRHLLSNEKTFCEQHP